MNADDMRAVEMRRGSIVGGSRQDLFLTRGEIGPGNSRWQRRQQTDQKTKGFHLAQFIPDAQ